MRMRFGIPSLDTILGGDIEQETGAPKVDGGGLKLSESGEATSICLIGPDGTGKSLFSLHLACKYYWDNLEDITRSSGKIIYVSTDLRYEMAQRMEINFGLNRPGLDQSQKPGPSLLTLLPTSDLSAMAEFMASKTMGRPQIGFIDLASDSAGDDWALVIRTLSLLDFLQSDQPRHLLVLDAVEGLETLSGETDAYGQNVSRRARIALMIRLASHKCHLAFIVEEMKEGERLAEEFVADVVIRLRAQLVNGYTRRTLEIEKARGQESHVRGPHPYDIGGGKSKASIIVFPSLHYQGGHYLRTLEHKRHSASAIEITFGIRHLDGLLVNNDNLPATPTLAGKHFALIGEAATFKSYVADAFLAQAFRDVAATFADAALLDKAKWEACWTGSERTAGVAILCSSQPRAREDIYASIATWLLRSNRAAWEMFRQAPQRDVLIKSFREHISTISPRLQVDLLAIQDQPGPRLFHRLDELIHRSIKKLDGFDSSERGRIRLVIDDVTGFRTAYPDLSQDPLLLRLVTRLIKSQGISALSVATQPSRPDITPMNAFDSELRSLVDGVLLAWRVPFFGSSRIAITLVSRLEQQAAIRSIETKPPDFLSEKPIDVNPELELYDGLEQGKPEPVPLEVRLYAETPAFVKYIDQENRLFNELFPFPSTQRGDANVLTAVSRDSYDSLRDYCYLSASVNLPKTLILQIDEFWRPARNQGMLQDLRSYVSERVDSSEGADPYEDHYAVFRLGTSENVAYVDTDDTGELRVHEYPKRVRTRRHFFPEYRLPGPTITEEKIDRIPYMWDFGFLSLSHDDWYSAVDAKLPIYQNSLSNICKTKSDFTATVGAVLDSLRKPSRFLAPRTMERVARDQEELTKLGPGLFREPSSWRVFLEACGAVMRQRFAKNGAIVRAFDLARPGTESFSCLIFEIWMSEILEKYSARVNALGTPEAENDAKQFINKISSFDPEEQFSIVTLLDKYWIDLYKTWMLLAESIELESFVDMDSRFSFKADLEKVPASAVRHWYKTATDADSVRYSAEAGLPARLPGYFSTRGDWTLAMAAGSRSERLGTRAMDLLNSRRANITRLQQGLGLPVRDIGDPKGFSRFRTRLSYVNDNRRRCTLSYADLIGLGADSTINHLCSRIPVPEHDVQSLRDKCRVVFGPQQESFFWLFRSRVKDYDRHSRMWQKWLVRVILLLQGVKREQANTWKSGFYVYDQIAIHELKNNDNPESLAPSEIRDYRTYKKFKELVAFVKDEFTWHTTTRP